MSSNNRNLLQPYRLSTNRRLRGTAAGRAHPHRRTNARGPRSPPPHGRLRHLCQGDAPPAATNPNDPDDPIAIAYRRAQEASQEMNPELIYDVGMNNGDDAAYYLWRGFRVVAIEPNPTLVAAATDRFSREIDGGRLTILNVAVAAEDGERQFWISLTDSRLSSLFHFHNDGTADARQILVRCRTFRSILNEHGVPFYMKVDIQGNDRLCVEALEPDNVPKFLSIEFSLARDMPLLNLLQQRGFTRFKLISQRDFLPLELPIIREARWIQLVEQLNQSRRLPSRVFRRLGGRRWINQQFARRRRIPRCQLDDFTFPPGSSGPFGDDLLGRWLSYDETCVTAKEFLRLRKRDPRALLWAPPGIPPNPFWVDLHARS